MAVNELVSRRLNEHVSRKNKATMRNGFRLYRNAAKGPKSPTAEKVSSGRKPGRPPLYGKDEREFIAGLLTQLGLTKTQKKLESDGAKVSMTVLRSVAKEYKIEFQKGRPTVNKAA